MNQLKFLTIDAFESQLKIYEIMATAIQKELAPSAPPKYTLTEALLSKPYKTNMSILIESTFLQIYANLEESLYYECEHQLIKKKASLSRFEIPLAELGYSIDNEHWHALINLSKIRNCLLHGNGRIDSDHYGLDTREIINTINSDAGIALIDIIASPLQKDSFTIRIKAPFLHYCLTKIKGFIGA